MQTLHEYKMVCPIYTMERDGSVCSECLDRGMHRLLVNRCKESSLVKSLATLGEQIFLESQAISQKLINLFA